MMGTVTTSTTVITGTMKSPAMNKIIIQIGKSGYGYSASVFVVVVPHFCFINVYLRLKKLRKKLTTQSQTLKI